MLRWDCQFLFVDKTTLGFIFLCWLDRQVCCTEDISDIFASVEQGCVPVSSVTRDCFLETLDTDFSRLDGSDTQRSCQDFGHYLYKEP